MLLDMLTKDPDVMIVQLDGPKFQLNKYLADPRMNTNFEWVQMLTTLFERMLTCLGQGERIARILVCLHRVVFSIDDRDNGLLFRSNCPSQLISPLYIKNCATLIQRQACFVSVSFCKP